MKCAKCGAEIKEGCIYCSVDEGSNNMVAMLNDLRVFCTSKEQETIDMLANMFSMLETYETIFS